MISMFGRLVDVFQLVSMVLLLRGHTKTNLYVIELGEIRCLGAPFRMARSFSKDETEVNVEEVTLRSDLQVVKMTIANPKNLSSFGNDCNTLNARCIEASAERVKLHLHLHVFLFGKLSTIGIIHIFFQRYFLSSKDLILVGRCWPIVATQLKLAKLVPSHSAM